MGIAGQAKTAVLRNYWQDIQPNERADIEFIVTTLAYKSLPSVFYNKKKLEDAGDRINNVHPLRFLLVIFSDPKLNAGVRAIESRDLLWGNFVGGTYSSLKEETESNNMDEACIQDFCMQLNINAADAYQQISNSLRQEKWDAFMKLLFVHVPRNEGYDRYDM